MLRVAHVSWSGPSPPTTCSKAELRAENSSGKTQYSDLQVIATRPMIFVDGASRTIESSRTLCRRRTAGIPELCPLRGSNSKFTRDHQTSSMPPTELDNMPHAGCRGQRTRDAFQPTIHRSAPVPHGPAWKPQGASSGTPLSLCPGGDLALSREKLEEAILRQKMAIPVYFFTIVSGQRRANCLTPHKSSHNKTSKTNAHECQFFPPSRRVNGG